MHAGGLRASPLAARNGGTRGGCLSGKASPDRRGRHRHGQDAGVSDPGNPQRQARGHLHRNKVASRTAFREGHSVSTEIFRAEAESGGHEGSRKFPMPRKGLPHGGPTLAPGPRRAGPVPADPRLGKGDRAELNFLADDSDLWQRLDARRDTCTGTKCAQFDRCFLTAMHQRAAAADLIIVNHHLFFADLALKQDDFGSVLPEYEAVVFDEAHEIEDVASDYFGREVSNYRFEELARDAEMAFRVTRVGNAALLKQIARTRERARSFFEAFPGREGRFPFDNAQRANFLEQNREAYDAMVNALKSLEAEIASLSMKPEELLNIARRAMELRGELSFLFETSEGNYVYWFERRNKGTFVAATPIDVSALLREHLFEQFETIVLTSATLAVEGRFQYLKQRLGVDMASERVLPSEFDFGEQALLYLPANLPDVRDSAFPERAAQEITRLLEISKGRAFCLFTSYAQMNDLHERVRTRVRFPILLQGSAPRSALLEKFRNTAGAVLFATSSFWQGVDVRGEQLSCVIVDKLPFAVPSDPIVAARVRALTEDGRNAFAEYQVPEAVLALKQGFGRLIRSRTDRGVLAILDNRIQRMQYGKIFMESLPAYATTRDIAAVERFMKKP